ncbi:hypothetical protein AB0M45_00760 [Nocardia sp. NPDC051787]|uniref:hypothetical protein n=1 Tax=Nocardia sp. NPDC051787 TaxID=3155415 RepID=UPI0034173377
MTAVAADRILSAAQAFSVAQRLGADFAPTAGARDRATYTGLLELFLEQFDGGTGLAGVLAVPVMLGAGSAHALAPDLLLEPVLVELGATAALPGLYLSDRIFAEDGVIDRYSGRWRSVAQALIHSSKAANHA